MNKRMVYMLCFISQAFMGLELAASQTFKLGFAEILINSPGCTQAGSIQVKAQSDDPTRLIYILTNSSGGVVGENKTGLFVGLAPGTYTIVLRDLVTAELQQATVVVSDLVPLTIRRIQVFNPRVSGGTGSLVIETRGGLGDVTVTRLGADLLGKTALLLQDQVLEIGPLVAGSYTFSLQSQDGCPPITFSIQIVEPTAV